jgi:hypothetical protein
MLQSVTTRETQNLDYEVIFSCYIYGFVWNFMVEYLLMSMPNVVLSDIVSSAVLEN